MLQSRKDYPPAILGGTPVRPQGAPAWPIADSEILQSMEQAVRSGTWGCYQGAATTTLQERLAHQFRAEHVVLCSSGTVAVELALRGLQIGPGDEVILAGYDFRGNFLNVLTVGAVPVLVDLDPISGQLSPEKVAAAITDRTRAVIASHLHGVAVDLDALKLLLAGRKIALLEDACQMPGAQLGSVKAGLGGDVGVISFGGSKLLSAGRGGAILTQRADVVSRIRRYGFRGNEAYPLSELQAAVLIPQLEKLDALRTQRRQWVAQLTHRLVDVPGLTLVQQAPSTKQVSPFETDYYKVAFRYDAEQFGGLSRDLFAAAMQAEGMALYPGFRALHRLHARSRYRQAGVLTEAERADETWLVLHHPLLLEGADSLHDFLNAVEKIREFAEQIEESSGRLARSAANLWEADA